ncbi:MAG: geranylgeranylglyceryl/heptaprenylglyceryl phosphate synthase [Candidatus Nitrosocaldaceae archaeon]
MGRIEDILRMKCKEHTLCFILLDSEMLELVKAVEMAKDAEELGVDAILVGGSSAIDQIELSNIIQAIKSKISIPVILFPGNVTGISPYADAILFSSLLNSENPYYISQAQALGALAIEKYKLESIPMAYLIIGDGSTAWFVGQARGIPFDKPKIAVMYALAAKYMGMRALYLEAGSGASRSVDPKMVSYVRNSFEGLLIVGGGIKNGNIARELSKAGANAIVIGTAFEENGSKVLRDILSALK